MEERVDSNFTLHLSLFYFTFISVLCYIYLCFTSHLSLIYVTFISVLCYFYLCFQVVVNALIKAIPSIFNVLLVCLVFWLIFGIVGVQFFAGKFHKCVDKDGVRVSWEIVKNRSQCAQYNESGYTWENSAINFDNVLNAYLALFQVVSVENSSTIIYMF